MQVSIRAFFPIWAFLYVVQFLLMPVVAKHYWLSLFVGNSLYLLAFGYYSVITFLGYNGTVPFPRARAYRRPRGTKTNFCNAALPFLHHTELLLSPVIILTILWFVSLFGFNLPKHLAPVLWAGAGLRRHI